MATSKTCALCRFPRSEEHTSELQSQSNLVCRLLLEKKKKKKSTSHENISNCPHHSKIYSFTSHSIHAHSGVYSLQSLYDYTFKLQSQQAVVVQHHT